MIPSVNYDQHEILKNILELCGIERVCADLTYGNGSFYKEIKMPLFCLDIQPLESFVIESCSTNTPIEDSALKSVVFDPPFLTYIKSGREHNSVMAKRFGGYWRYDELEDHYRKTLIEANRILGKKGVMIFKCQDIIHNHKMHCTHINIMEWAKGLFRLKDLFILPAKSRMPMPKAKGAKERVQKHARIFHSYFMVLEKIK